MQLYPEFTKVLPWSCCEDTQALPVPHSSNIPGFTGRPLAQPISRLEDQTTGWQGSPQASQGSLQVTPLQLPLNCPEGITDLQDIVYVYAPCLQE